jgi:ElaB/YqjD/DUF883 family membrane-anchored ribosome-binding protein
MSEREGERTDQETRMGEARDEFERRTSEVQGRAQQYGEAATEKASEYGERMQGQIDAGRQQAAEGMERGAEKVREGTAASTGIATKAGTKVADRMETAAGYLRAHNTQEMLSDVESYAKSHPGKALAGAVVTGFLIGRILR